MKRHLVTSYKLYGGGKINSIFFNNIFWCTFMFSKSNLVENILRIKYSYLLILMVLCIVYSDHILCTGDFVYVIILENLKSEMVYPLQFFVLLLFKTVFWFFVEAIYIFFNTPKCTNDILIQCYGSFLQKLFF